MKATTHPKPETITEIPALAILPKPKASAKRKEQFRIVPFTNQRTGGQSWRVTGFKRDGKRIRENFSDETRAAGRKLELETEWLTGQQETGYHATKLSPDQLRLAETVVLQLGEDWPLALDAVSYWKRHGKER